MQRGGARSPGQLRERPTRTSDSHPITLSWVLQHGAGALGLCYCPGKKVTRDGVTWDRCLEKDLARLRASYGVTTIICLLNQAELRHYKLRAYRSAVAGSGLALEEFPIVEMAPPESLDATAAFVRSLGDRLERGEKIAVHCRGGVGRAGLVAACALLQLGHFDSAGRAIEAVRKLRCRRAVESSSQEKFIERYATRLRAERRRIAIAPGRRDGPFGWGLAVRAGEVEIRGHCIRQEKHDKAGGPLGGEVKSPGVCGVGA